MVDLAQVGETWKRDFLRGVLPLAGLVGIPDKQLRAGLVLLEQKWLDRGNFFIQVRDLAKVCGVLCHWMSTVKRIGRSLKPIAKLLKWSPGTKEYWESAFLAMPEAGPECTWAYWEEFWSCIECLRLWLRLEIERRDAKGTPELYESSKFCMRLIHHFRFEDLVNAGPPCILAGTDASGEGGGFVVWYPEHLKMKFSIDVKSMFQLLRSEWHANEEVQIAIAELWVWVVGTLAVLERMRECEKQEQWRPPMLTAVDNQDATSWFTKERAAPPVAGALLRAWDDKVQQLLGNSRGFMMKGPYITSEKNFTPDRLSRPGKDAEKVNKLTEGSPDKSKRAMELAKSMLGDPPPWTFDTRLDRPSELLAPCVIQGKGITTAIDAALKIGLWPSFRAENHKERSELAKLYPELVSLQSEAEASEARSKVFSATKSDRPSEKVVTVGSHKWNPKRIGRGALVELSSGNKVVVGEVNFPRENVFMSALDTVHDIASSTVVERKVQIVSASGLLPAPPGEGTLADPAWVSVRGREGEVARLTETRRERDHEVARLSMQS